MVVVLFRQQVVLLTHFLHGGGYIQSLDGFITRFLQGGGFIQTNGGPINSFSPRWWFYSSTQWFYYSSFLQWWFYSVNQWFYHSLSPRWWFYLDGSTTDLLDSDGFAVQLSLIQTLDALVCLHHRWHGNEAEALGAGTLGVRDDLRSNNLRVGSYNLNAIRLFLLYLYVRGYSNALISRSFIEFQRLISHQTTRDVGADARCDIGLISICLR